MTGTIDRLRRHTRPQHDIVDAAFGAYRLDDRAAYAAFLHAHARALPAVEAVLAGHQLPGWRMRTPLLAADLADLGGAMPPPLPFALPAGDGAAWGALYVIEGSRLGGTLLARGVAPDLPGRYLGARHQPGEWRTLLAAIDDEGARRPADWTDAAIAGAGACFRLYADAA